MAVTRLNILTNPAVRQQYTQGVMLLKREFTGPTTATLGIGGPSRPVSTYDLFVVWHHTAMLTFTPPTQADRNAAHRGPVFCPWHRFMLYQLELNLQRVLQDTTFGLPYWDWGADGERSAAEQRRSALWAANALGGSGSPVRTGPFKYNTADPNSFRVRIEANVNGRLVQVNRGLRRALGSQIATLPTNADVQAAVAMTPYDTPPWDTSSSGFRNRLEGWPPPGAPALHNRIHVWVGGDMLPSSSPNDPVFYLNHCNVDRLWESWLTQHRRSYLPPQSAPSALRGHRINDQMDSLISAPMRPAEMLDMRSIYTYEDLAA